MRHVAALLLLTGVAQAQPAAPGSPGAPASSALSSSAPVSSAPTLAAQPSASALQPAPALAPSSPPSAIVTPPPAPGACIEKLPAGKARPPLTETFPTKGLAGHALPLVVTVTHGPAETVLPTGFRFQADAPEAKTLKDAGFLVPSAEGGAGPQVVRSEGATTSSKVTLSFVALPKKPGRHELTLPPMPITMARASGEVVTLCTRPHTIVVEAAK